MAGLHRGGVRDRRHGRRLATGPADGCGRRDVRRAGCVGGQHRDPLARARRGGRLAGDRHPARHLGGSQAEGRTWPARVPRRDADDPCVLLPAPVRAALRHRRTACPDRDRDLRAAPRGSADGDGHPQRVADRARGFRLLRIDAAPDPVEGADPAGQAVDDARRQPDDHDGSRHGRDRRRGRCPGPRPAGARRPEAARRRRGTERRHRDRDDGDRARPGDDGVEPARARGRRRYRDRRAGASPVARCGSRRSPRSPPPW